jgi:hypothetical protein
MPVEYLLERRTIAAQDQLDELSIRPRNTNRAVDHLFIGA